MAETISGIYLMLEGTNAQLDAVQYRREPTWSTETPGNNALRYKDDSGSDHYIYEYTAMNDLTDVNIPTIASGDLLIFDGVNFVAINSGVFGGSGGGEAVGSGHLIKYPDGYTIREFSDSIYKVVGSGAVDLSVSLSGDLNQGAVGRNSFATNSSNTAGQNIFVYTDAVGTLSQVIGGTDSVVQNSANLNGGIAAHVEGFFNCNAPIIPEYIDAVGTKINQSNVEDYLDSIYFKDIYDKDGNVSRYKWSDPKHGVLNTISWSSLWHFDASGNLPWIPTFFDGENQLGKNNHVEGGNNLVLANSVHVEGQYNAVRRGANGSHVEGNYNIVDGPGNHVEGNSNLVADYYGPNNTHVEGVANIVKSINHSHIEGYGNEVHQNDSCLHIEGTGNKTWIGDYGQSHTGFGSSESTHVEGYGNEFVGSTNSHIEGRSNSVSLTDAHVEGVDNRFVTLVEGHIEGRGNYEGWYIKPSGQGTVEGGVISVAHVEGVDNKIWLNNDTSHMEGYSNELFTRASHSHVEGYNNEGRATGSHVEGQSNITAGSASHAEGFDNQAGLSTLLDKYTDTGAFKYPLYEQAHGRQYLSFGHSAHAEGSQNIAGTSHSHVEGYGNQTGDLETRQVFKYKQDGSQESETYTWLKHNTYDSGVYTGGDYGYWFGENAHAEGYQNKAIALAAHAEGINTIAGTSIVDGTFSGVIGGYADVYTHLSKGIAAHAEGIGARATGSAAHAGGLFTQAPNDGMYAIGKYNNPTVDSIFEVGIGTESALANGLRVDLDGIVYADSSTIPLLSGAISKALVTKEYLSYVAFSGVIPDSLWDLTNSILTPDNDPQRLELGTDISGVLDAKLIVGNSNVTGGINDIVVSGTTGGAYDGLYINQGGNVWFNSSLGLYVSNGTGAYTSVYTISDGPNKNYWEAGVLYIHTYGAIGIYQAYGGSTTGTATVTYNAGQVDNQFSIKTMGGIDIGDVVKTTTKFVSDNRAAFGWSSTHDAGVIEIIGNEDTELFKFRANDTDYLDIHNSGYIVAPKSSGFAIENGPDRTLITKEYFEANSGSNVYSGDRGGPTANMPSGVPANYPMYFNTDLGYPIWFNGTNWVNSTGAFVMGPQ